MFARLIRQCKYAEREDLLKPLSGWMVEEVRRQAWHSCVDAVTFVPTHWTRRLARPFHAAELLASAISVSLSIPRVALLRRTRGGPHQTGLSFTARVENVRGAFAVRRGTRLEGATLMLVDDVRTTGATVEECTRVLLRAGAAKVYAVVAARVDWAPGTPAPIDLI